MNLDFLNSLTMEGIIAAAVPFFFIGIFAEMGIAKLRGLKLYRAEDTLSNLALGTFQQMVALISKAYVIVIYGWFQNRIQFFTLPTDTFLSAAVSWAFAFLAVDFAYYWFHRKAHEVNILWASHVAHHSSEEYNLSVALRQSALQAFFSTFFYAPLSFFGITWQMFSVCYAFNLIYQFWIHTSAVNKLGFLESFMNTPSHHRVHHGRNLKYMDKNHAGVFIIWDKLFGSFVPEQETPIYGITTPIRSYDPFWATVHHLIFVLKDVTRARTFSDAFKILLGKPGWRPEYLGGAIIAQEPNPQAKKFESASRPLAKIISWVLFLTATGIAIYLMNFGKTLEPVQQNILASLTAGMLSLSGFLLTGNPRTHQN